MPSEGEPSVYLIDDDADVRAALDALLRSIGLTVECYGSVEEFLAAGRLGSPGCLLLDVRLSGQSGLAFQSELVGQGVDTPVILMSGHADVPMAVRAMKNGAIEFLTKPVRPQDLIDAVNLALARDAARRQERRDADRLRQAFETLSEREREVMDLIVGGHSNKTAAEHLGLSEATVKAHRASVTRKMGAGSLAQLVDMAKQLKAGR